MTGEYICGRNLCFDPLSKEENVAALASLSEIVRTCIGPRGRLKLVRHSSGGHTAVTSSSSRIFHSLSIKNPFNRMLVCTVKSHLRTYGDGGLLCAYFPLSLVEHSLLLSSSNLKSGLFEHFLQTYVACLGSEENACVRRFDPSDLRHLRSVTRTLVSSKLECLLSASQRDHVCSLLLETFLNIFPSGDGRNCLCVSLVGRDTRASRLLNGLLVRVPTTEWTSHHRRSARVTLLTSFLEHHDALQERIASRLISARVEIVLCQKVMHPRLRKRLNDAGVAVADQLGTETTSLLRYILDDHATWQSEDELSFDTVECSEEEVGGKRYLLLRKEEKSFCSLLICHYNREFLSELKVVCEQVIATLFRLLQSPKVCFGAGCTDVFTAVMLVHKIKSESRELSDVLPALSHFLQSLVAVAVSSHQESPLNFVVDGRYGHLWKNGQSDGLPEETCCCGHCSRAPGSSWHPLSDLMHVPVPSGAPPFDEPRVVDELGCRVSALSVGGGAAVSLLKTRLCIFTGHQEGLD